MNVKIIHLCICLVCLVSVILFWMTSNKSLNKIMIYHDYRGFIVEKPTTGSTICLETGNPLTTNASRLPVQLLGANYKTNLISINNKLETNKNLSNSTSQSVLKESHYKAVISTSSAEDTSNRQAEKITVKTAKSMMKNLYDHSRNETDNFTAYVSSVLAKPWRHDVNRTKLFSFFLTKETRKTVYDELMLTQKHRKKNNRSAGIYHKTNLFPKPPYKSCSVVGSSGILKGSNCGRVIDDKDFVIRFNLASIAGFEEDVGSKTNMTTMNPSILYRYGRLKKASDRVNFKQSKLVDQEGLIWTSAQDIGLINRTNEAIQLLKDPKLTLVSWNIDHFYSIGKFWKRYGLNRHLTTGFYFVTCALDLCSVVHLFGFWPFGNSLDGQTIPAHYYDGIKLSTTYHDSSYELRLYLTMHQLGMLKFHIDDCSTDINGRS
ncbi:alpha-N-acetylneuraminide alpha-2,8-sialyltransferase-like [Amphiura filiformis]|uniref:alpha-N-acetylneuraminide alpha-2,8-sialyltransferase-like n=1 Tax=Amphiura filiformis TaxID=82378 RepID=UPI003B216AC7